MSPEFQRILESKQAYRTKLAQKPIAEKLRIVEELAERTLALRKDTSSMLPEEPWPIPKGWRWARIGDVATIVGGGTPRTEREEYFGGDVPWITPADLSGYKDKMISRGARNISKEGLANSGARLLPAKTILFSSRAPIGYVAIAENPVATNQGFKSFILGNELLPEYVYYYLQRAKEFAVALASGTTFLEISGKNAARLPIPIPPLPEQRRIVAEIEKQFSRLEEGVGALKRVLANLKRYRAAVLKAACEGQLVPTEAERQRSEGRGTRGGIKYETGEELLARILAERRKNWQGKGPYKEPALPNNAKLGSIPTGWIVASLEQLTNPDRPICYGILMPKENVANGVLFVTVKDMKGDKIGLDSLRRTAPEIAMKYARASLKTGDLLLSIRGTYGRVAEVPKELNGGNITQDTARLDVTRIVSHRYIATYLRNPACQQYFKRVARGVAVKGVNIGDVRPAPIPLPPLAEQSRIVAEVERRLSVVEEMESTVEANLQRATRLRQSILQKAFTGQLLN